MASKQEESSNTQSVTSNWGDAAENLRHARLEHLKELGDIQEADNGMIFGAEKSTSVVVFNAERIRSNGIIRSFAWTASLRSK